MIFSTRHDCILWHSVQNRWSKLEECYHEGLVQSIGLRDCTVYQLQQLIAHSKLVPTAVSVEVHPFYKNEELVSFCKKKVQACHAALAAVCSTPSGCLLLVLDA